MNQIKHITQLPDLEWNTHSDREYQQALDDVIGQTDIMLQLGNAAVVGLTYENLISPPWFWFLLAKNYSFRDLILFKNLSACIPAKALTAVQTDFQAGARFAKFYGFEDTETIITYGAHQYTIFRKI